MLRTLCYFGWFLMFLACCALGWELAILADTRSFKLSSLGELWHSLHPSSLGLYQAIVEQHISGALWDKVLAPVLVYEAVFVFAISGLVLALLPWMAEQLKRDGQPELA